MIPKKFEFLLFSLLMSGVISYLNIGMVDNFLFVWFHAFLKAYVVAFPAVVIVVPIVKRLVAKLVKQS